MTISIPNTVFDTYYEVCDWLLSNNYTSYTCTLVYPARREVCTNCVINPVSGGSTNVHAHGGPMPFSFGLCPLCGGNGYKEIEDTASIRLRVYWSRKDWIKVAGSVNIADASVQVIGNLSDLPKVMQANQIKIVDAQTNATFSMSLACEPFLHGFGKNKYFVAFLKRI